MRSLHSGQIECTASVPSRCWIALVAGILAAAFVLVDAEPGASAGENDPVIIAQNEQNEQARPRRHRHRKPSDEQPLKEGEEAGDEGPAASGRNVEYETVKLVDGSEVKVEKWGETYLDYEYRPPLNLDDQIGLGRNHLRKTEAEVVLDYADGLARQFPNRDLLSICLDIDHNHLYWIDVYRNYSALAASIHRANLDGGNIQTLVNKLREPNQLALDLTNHMMYWTENGVERKGIHRAPFDGSKKEHFLHVDANTCAVDGENGILYYATSHQDHGGRIFRVGLDGAGEALLFERTRPGLSLILSSNERELFWTAMPGDNILRADLKSRKFGVICRPGQRAWSLAIDPVDNRIYWISRGTEPTLRRAKLDGTQEELLATGLSRPGGLALDTKHRHVYWTETYGGIPIFGRIRRIKMPPALMPKSRPAPPLITAIQPALGSVGTQVTLMGKGFTDATEVTFIGLGTGEHISAKFHVVSDKSMELTVPALPAECSKAAIVVLTRGGVTVTLPRNLPVVRPKPGGAHTKFDPWAKGQNFSLFVATGGYVAPLERAIAYVSDGGRAFPGNEGKDVFFLKSGAKTAPRYGMNNSIVYHEPFAIINGRDGFAEDSRLVAVPAIRPSFIDTLFECPKKAD